MKYLWMLIKEEEFNLGDSVLLKKHEDKMGIIVSIIDNQYIRVLCVDHSKQDLHIGMFSKKVSVHTIDIPFENRWEEMEQLNYSFELKNLSFTIHYSNHYGK